MRNYTSENRSEGESPFNRFASSWRAFVQYLKEQIFDLKQIQDRSSPVYAQVNKNLSFDLGSSARLVCPDSKSMAG